MPVTEIEIYDALRNKIGEESAKTLLEFIDLRVEKEFERKKDLLATKQDIAELRSATKQDIAELRAEVKQDIAELKAELEVKIEKVKTTLIKWMFIFWAGQVGVLVAILTLFFRVLK